MSREIVHDQNGIWLVLTQARQHIILETVNKDRDRGSGFYGRHRDDTVAAERSQNGEALPFRRGLAERTLTQRSPGVAPRQVR